MHPVQAAGIDSPVTTSRRMPRLASIVFQIIGNNTLIHG